jgi:glycosyltransferase involved in cell wall biosynthesis
MIRRPRVALVHDYLTQLGGAERVVLEMTRAFPGAPLYTSIYAPERTHPAFRDVDVRPSVVDRVPLFHEHHRAALPLLPPTFSSMRVDADVVLCSSSGWAHGVRAPGPKVVYCHAVARWLSQRDRYLGDGNHLRAVVSRGGLAVAGPALRHWDRRAAASATRYLANSRVTQEAVRQHYGIAANLLQPPASRIDEPPRAVAGLTPGFFLCVTRLVPYKNADVVCAAFEALPGERLLVVGHGPERDRLGAVAPANVEFRDHLGDDELRWCYEQCVGLVAASHEDFGLTVLEAAAAGRPAATLRDGGYLETVVDGITGVFFDRPEPRAVADAVASVRDTTWDADAIRAHASRFSPEQFHAALRAVVDDVLPLS